MPTYDFRCEDCSHGFRSTMSISDRDRKDARACPGCGSSRVVRVFLTAPYVGGNGSRDGCGSCSPSPSRCRTCSA